MNPADVSSFEQTSTKKPLDLDARYLKIGISAVAAAVRYQGEARNPNYAPIDPQPLLHVTDEAA
ncbi:MAG TPA: hypothetical protein VHA77_01665 [Xanthobacteraceae bacterium]|jgi:hypothetical protein|nr:hypothetical protein [Xanthobacteraceae bacterium]